jgi:hypothetical protein
VAAAVTHASAWRQVGALFTILGAMFGAWIVFKLVQRTLFLGDVSVTELVLATAGLTVVAACLFAYRRLDPFARYFFAAVASLPLSLIAAAPIIHFAGGTDRAWLGIVVMLPASVLYVVALRRYREARVRA